MVDQYGNSISMFKRFMPWLVLLLVVILAAIMWYFFSNRVSNLNQLPSEISTADISGFDDTQNGPQVKAGKLRVNGQLIIDGVFVLQPSDAPLNPVSGEIYIGGNNNQLRYFNGQRFVTVADENRVITSIAGVNGQISLGSGLEIVGNTITTTPVDVPVNSVQGRTGDISFGSGDGINISGTTISNSGLLSFGGATGTIDVGAGLSVSSGVVSNTGVTQLDGTPNQINVSGNSGAISISLPQDIDSSSSPVFSGLRLSGLVNCDTIDTDSSGNLSCGFDAGGSSGSPTNASYLTVNNEPGLSDERALLVNTTNLTLSDGGAGTNLTLNTVQDISTVSSPSFNNLNVTTNLTAGAISGSGSGITAINATNISSGTLSNARLNPAVSLLGQTIGLAELETASVNSAKIVDGSVANIDLVNSSLSVTAGNGLINGGSVSLGGSTTLTVGAGDGITVNLSDVAVDATVCRTSGNCAGVGGGVTTAGGTTNTIALFTGAQSVGDSIISQGGTTITIAGDLQLGSDLAVTQGGTGVSSFTANGLLYGNGTGNVQVTAAPISGQIIVANALGVPTFTTLTGDITVSATGVTTIQPNSVALGSDTTGNYQTFTAAGDGITVTGTAGEGTTPSVAVDTSVCRTSGNCAAAGAAGGDLTGNYPNPTIARLQGSTLNITTPVAGNILIYNGTASEWQNRLVSGDILFSENGLATIQANAVLLGADTVGNYVASLSGNAQILVSGSGSESAAVSLSIQSDSIGDAQLAFNTGQALTATSAPTFSGLTITNTANANSFIQNGNQVCDTSGNCLGGGAGGANTSLSNLSSVAINTSLLSGSSLIDLGSNANPFRDVYLGGTTTSNFRLTGTATAARTLTLPDSSGTICLDSGNCIGGGGGAPSGASYLTLALDGSLSSERVFTVGSNLTLTDGGVNSNLTLNLSPNVSILGQSIDTSEITDGTIQAVDLETTNAATNTYLLSYDTVTGGFTYVDPTTAGGTKVNSLNALTGALNLQGTAGQVTVTDNATDTLTISLNSAVSLLGQTIGLAELETASVNSAKIVDGSVANIDLVNSSLSVTAGNGLINGGSVSLGGSTTLTVGAGDGITVNLSDVAVDATVCRTSGNCAGTGGGVTTAGGTTNTLALFTGAQSIGDSIISQGGTTITIAGDLQLGSDLAVTQGGTGVSSFTANGLLYGNGTGNVQVTAAPISGQIIVANALGVPTFTTLTGDITVSATGVTTIQPNSVALGSDTTGNYQTFTAAGDGITVTGTAGEGTTPSVAVDTSVCRTSGNCAGVGGTGDITGTGTANQIAYFNGTKNIVSSANLLFNGTDFTVGTNKLFVNGTTGNVGIGTTSPTYKLDVTGDINTSGYYRQAGNIVVNTTTAANNTFIGLNAGNTSTTGTNNTALGNTALQSNTTGTANTAIGSGALSLNTTGIRNTSIGSGALSNNDSGAFNTAIGFLAGTFDGNSTANQTSSGSVYLGYDTRASANGNFNETVIGYNTVGNGSNSVTLGNTGVTKTILQGNVGIGTTTPTALLHLLGSQPLAVATNGTNATQALQVTGGKGGNTTGTTGQLAGVGANLNLTSGAGGDAPAGSTNGNGGSITIQGGAPGSGLGTAGSYGNILLAASGGNVGIGTTVPAYLLDVSGGTGIVGQFSGRVIGGNAVNSNEFTTKSQLDAVTSGTAGAFIQGGNSFGATATLGTNDNFGLNLKTNGIARLEISNTGAVNIGNVNTNTNALLQLASSGNNAGFLVLDRYANNSNSNLIENRKARGTSGTPLVVQNGDGLGGYTLSGYDGAKFVLGAAITATVDGTPGLDDLPTRLTFFTTPDGSPNSLERLRITNQGNVSLGTTSNAARLDVKNSVASTVGLNVIGATGQTAALATFARSDFNRTFNITNNASVQQTLDFPSSLAYDLRIAGETGARLWIRANGGLEFGSATVFPDVQLLRTGTSELTISDTASGTSAKLTVLGNVGIGATSSTYKLEVSGGTGIVGQFSGRVIGGDAVNTNEFATLSQVNSAASGTNFIQNGTALQTANFNISGNGFFGGNVGIGTTTPTALLHLLGSQPLAVATNGTNATQALQVTGGKGGNTTGTTGQLAGVGANLNLTGGAGGNAPAGSTNGNGGNITLQGGAPGAGAGTAGLYGDLILQQSGGNVGIGTTNPNSKLTIVGTSANSTVLRLINSDAQTRLDFEAYGQQGFKGNVFSATRGRGSSGSPTAVQNGNMLFNIETGGYYSTTQFDSALARIQFQAAGNFTTTSTPTRIVFATHPASTPGVSLDRLTIDSTGFVGIGTTNPSYLLDVAGDTGIVGQFSGRVIGGNAVNSNEFTTKSQLDAVTSGTAGAFIQGGNSFGATATLGTNDNFGLNLKTNNVNRLYITSDGKVGINTPTPAGGIHILNVGTTADRTSLVLDTTSADFRRRGVVYSTNGVARWQLDVDNANETGGNNGSIFGLNTYADDGTFLRNAFAIRRESGDWNVLPSVSGDLPRFGIGVTASGADVGSKLHVRSTLGNAIKTTNITSSTNSVQNAFNIQAETSGVIANGFGNQILFQIKQGSGGTANTIAGIATERNGANNSGDLILKTSNAGSLTERLRIDSSGNVGIGATNPGNLLSVGALTTADASAKLAVGTGGAANEGIIIQAVASQTADLLQAQDSTGAVLAKIDATGNLTVKAATINGTLTVNGHIVSGNTTGTTTVAAGASCGTGCSVSISGNDTAGVITINAGTTAAAGIQATVTFANAYGSAARVVLTPETVPASSVFPQYYYGSSTTTFDLKSYNALTDSSTYTFSYQIIQ